MARHDWRRSVAEILDGSESCGAGFLVAGGVLLTCLHVVEGLAASGQSVVGISVVLRFPQSDGLLLNGRVVATWTDDVAVVALDPTESLDVPPGLSLGSSEDARRPSATVFGFPASAPPTGMDAYVSVGDRYVGPAGPLLQLSGANAIAQGFSGAPVVDDRTQVVLGMVTSFPSLDNHQRGLDEAFAVPAEVLALRAPGSAASVECPYRNLEPFTEEQSAWFHGREAILAQIRTRLQDEPRRLLLLGPSGSGKSSLARAGLLADLDGLTDHAGSRRWTVGNYHRAGDLVARGTTAAALELDSGYGWHLIVVDQLEEILDGEPTSRALLGELLRLADSGNRTSLVLVLRDDFYASFAAEAPRLMRLLKGSSVNVSSALEPDEIKRIIVNPARAVNLEVDPELVDLLVDDCLAIGGSSAGPSTTLLPLLEVALTQVWHARSSGRLTAQAYRKVGRVSGSVERWCEEAYQELTRLGLDKLGQQILTALVRPAEELGDVRLPMARRRRRLSDLLRMVEPGNADRTARRTLEILVRHRVVSAGGLDTAPDDDAQHVTERVVTDRRGEPQVELIHDAVVRLWTRIRNWIDLDRAFVVWERDASRDAARWLARNRDPDLLLKGEVLKESLLTTRGRGLPAHVHDWVRASEREDRRSGRRQAVLNWSLRVLLVVALLAAGLAYVQQRRADANAREAAAAAEHANALTLAAQAQAAVANGRLEVAQLEALASLAREPESEPTARAVWAAASVPMYSIRAFAGHRGGVTSLAYGRGHLLVSAGTDGDIRFWDNDSGHTAAAPLSAHRNTVSALSFNRDGTELLSGGWDGTLRLWDVAGHVEIGTPLSVGSGPVSAAALSPDGSVLAGAGHDGIVRLWRRDGGSIQNTLATHRGDVTSIAFGRRADTGNCRRRRSGAHLPLRSFRMVRCPDRSRPPPRQRADRVGLQPQGRQRRNRRAGRPHRAVGPNIGSCPLGTTRRHSRDVSFLRARRYQADRRRAGRNRPVMGPDHRATRRRRLERP